MEDFVACFAEVADPRQENIRHNLHELLMIALSTMLCGGEDCSDMPLFGQAKEPFLRQFLTLRHGIPSHDTFGRVFRLLDPAAFTACFTRFMQPFADTLEGVVAIDGKTLRHSFDRASGLSPLHMLHAWSVDQWRLLGQLAVDGKSNEITAVPRLLELRIHPARTTAQLVDLRLTDGLRVHALASAATAAARASTATTLGS